MNDAPPSIPIARRSRALVAYPPRFALFALVLLGILFGVAGRLDWLGGWLLSGIYVGFLAVFHVWGALRAPALLEERRRPAANVERWDKAILLSGRSTADDSVGPT